MAIKRKQISDAKVPATKHAKKKPKKTKKVKPTTLVAANKHATKDDGSNKSFPKSKLVSALFNDKDDLQSAFDGEFKLSRNHVKKLGRIIQQSDSQLKQALLLIYTNEGYKALKCKSFKAYIKKHQTITYDAALKQVWAAKVAYVVNGLDAIGFYSDNSMLAMKDLSDDQIEKVVEYIEEEHGEDFTINGKYTRKIVEDAIHSLGLGDKDVSDDDLDTKRIAKPEASTKKPSNAKQSNKEKVKQTESHSQFLKQFKMKTTKFKSSKAIITAFIETDAGKKPETVKKAIKLLSKHLKALEA